MVIVFGGLLIDVTPSGFGFRKIHVCYNNSNPSGFYKTNKKNGSS